MTEIRSPRDSSRYPDRNIECQEAIEGQVIALLDQATAAGWCVDDVTTALVDLADNLRLQADVSAHLDLQIAKLRRFTD